MRSSCHYTGSACCVMCVRKGETEQPCAYCLTSYRPVRCVSMWPCTIHRADCYPAARSLTRTMRSTIIIINVAYSRRAPLRRSNGRATADDTPPEFHWWTARVPSNAVYPSSAGSTRASSPLGTRRTDKSMCLRRGPGAHKPRSNGLSHI